MSVITGGCLCGEVRYETTSEPNFQCLCYCGDCQKVSGAAGYAVYGVSVASFAVTRGDPTAYSVTADSGRVNSRHFCPKCGTRVWAQINELDLVSVNGLTLDEPDHFKPTMTHYPQRAPDWCLVDENLEVLPSAP